MIRVAICDDEEIYRKSTEVECRAYFLNKCKKKSFIDSIDISFFSSGEELMASDEVFNILFLDIEMYEVDGIKVKDYFEKSKKQTRIIFLTSHKERVIEAFGKNVIGFLVKPLKVADFERIMDKVILDIDGKILEIEDNGQTLFLPMKQIKYIEAQDKYTVVITEKENYLLRKTMKYWEENLSEQDFCRVNKSFLVNWEYFVKEKDEIVLEKDKRIKISRKNKVDILQKYKEYLRRSVEKL